MSIWQHHKGGTRENCEDSGTNLLISSSIALGSLPVVLYVLYS